MRPKKKGVHLWKKGRLGERQMELKESIKEPKPRKTYKQEWTSYNLAQTKEFKLFQDILVELIDSLIEVRKPLPRRGRPFLDLKDMLFCCVMKVYFGKSTRRNIGYLHLAKGVDYITNVPHFNSILNYYDNPHLIPLLKHMVEQSGIPLRDVELDFATDASGFTTSLFGRWFNARIAKYSERRLYRKAHLTSGVATNIITAVTITEGFCHDSTQFEELVKTTAQNFNIREMSADAGYLARKHFDLISSVGAIPYIMFKKNCTAKARGSMVYKRMHEMFTRHNQEFLDHYHKRSNAESVFHMIKRKFGMHLFCRNEIAQTNELLCKCLAHNICVLIKEYYKLDKMIKFDQCSKKVVRNFCAT